MDLERGHLSWDKDMVHVRTQFEIVVVVVRCRGQYWAHRLVQRDVHH